MYARPCYAFQPSSKDIFGDDFIRWIGDVDRAPEDLRRFEPATNLGGVCSHIGHLSDESVMIVDLYKRYLS